MHFLEFIYSDVLDVVGSYSKILTCYGRALRNLGNRPWHYRRMACSSRRGILCRALWSINNGSIRFIQLFLLNWTDLYGKLYPKSCTASVKP